MDPCHLEKTVLMTPDTANFSGKVHGSALRRNRAAELRREIVAKLEQAAEGTA